MGKKIFGNIIDNIDVTIYTHLDNIDVTIYTHLDNIDVTIYTHLDNMYVFSSTLSFIYVYNYKSI